MAFKMKGHTLPGIKQRPSAKMADGRAKSSAFQAKQGAPDRRTRKNERGLTEKVWHDHNNSGKTYGEKGHLGEKKMKKISEITNDYKGIKRVGEAAEKGGAPAKKTPGGAELVKVKKKKTGPESWSQEQRDWYAEQQKKRAAIKEAEKKEKKRRKAAGF